MMNEENIKKSVGRIIKSYRKNLELTQTKLGDIIGINQRQVALIENGRSIPKLSTMIKMADLFECNIEDFFRFNIKDNKEDYTKQEILALLNYCDSEQLEKICSMIKIIQK